MTPSLAVVLGAAAAAPELRTPAAAVEAPSIAERVIAEEKRIGAASRIAERPFDGAQLSVVPLIMGGAVIMAAVIVTQTIKVAAEAPITVAEFIVVGLW
jgi:hypothetical protein